MVADVQYGRVNDHCWLKELLVKFSKTSLYSLFMHINICIYSIQISLTLLYSACIPLLHSYVQADIFNLNYWILELHTIPLSIYTLH